MTLETLIATAAPAVGMLISLTAVHSWLNRPHEKEHGELSSAIKEMGEELKNINIRLADIKLELAKGYVSKAELIEAVGVVRRDHLMLKDKTENYIFRKNLH